MKLPYGWHSQYLKLLRLLPMHWETPFSCPHTLCVCVCVYKATVLEVRGDLESEGPSDRPVLTTIVNLLCVAVLFPQPLHSWVYVSDGVSKAHRGLK